MQPPEYRKTDARANLKALILQQQEAAARLARSGQRQKAMSARHQLLELLGKLELLDSR